MKTHTTPPTVSAVTRDVSLFGHHATLTCVSDELYKCSGADYAPTQTQVAVSVHRGEHLS